MAAEVPHSYKVCANCVYWEGKREINSNMHNTKVFDTYGKCSNPKDYRSSTIHNTPQCPNFVAHPNVK